MEVLAGQLGAIQLLSGEGGEVVEVALEGEEVLTFAEVVGIVTGGGEVFKRVGGILSNEGGEAEGAMGVDKLA